MHTATGLFSAQDYLTGPLLHVLSETNVYRVYHFNPCNDLKSNFGHSHWYSSWTSSDAPRPMLLLLFDFKPLAV